jgi:hypothetical protein
VPTDLSPQHGLTVADLARRYRVGEDKVRGWIMRGELVGINTSDVRCAKPRYVVTPEALAEFERGRQVVSPPKQTRRKKRETEVDFYPD